MKNNHEFKLDPGHTYDGAEVLYDDDSAVNDPGDDAADFCEDHAFFRTGRRGFLYACREPYSGEPTDVYAGADGVRS